MKNGSNAYPRHTKQAMTKHGSISFNNRPSHEVEIFNLPLLEYKIKQITKGDKSYNMIYLHVHVAFH